jgi:hypothetical protein
VPVDTLEPITGDPDAVAAAARNLQAVAVEVEATSARLRALATGDDSWSGRAAVQARARSITLPPKLAKVRDSYATAGAALRRYATTLSEAQSASHTARQAASRAAADLQYTRAVRDAAAARDVEAATAARMAGLPAPVPTAARYESHLADAEARLRRAGAANAAAHDQQRRAARTAAATLHQASREGIHNKPWWRHALSSAAHWAQQTWADSLRDVAKGALTISAMAGLAAVALAVGGIAFPPLELGAGALESISMASGAVAMLSQTVLAATGNASWKTVGIDALASLPAVGSIARRVGFPALIRDTGIGVTDQRIGVPAPRPLTTVITTPPLKLSAIQSWGDSATLEDHVLRHGPDFGITDREDYARRASDFLQEAVNKRLPTKISGRDGTIRIYDPSTNTFGSYHPDGRTKTLFKPGNGEGQSTDSWAYWLKQAGKEPWYGNS